MLISHRWFRAMCLSAAVCLLSGVAFGDDIDELTAKLKSSSPHIRADAARRLGAMGPDAAPAPRLRDRSERA